MIFKENTKRNDKKRIKINHLKAIARYARINKKANFTKPEILKTTAKNKQLRKMRLVFF